MTPPSRLLLTFPIVGPLLVEYGEEGVESVRYWAQGEHPPAGTRAAPGPADELGRRIVAELTEYFRGGRRVFTLPLALNGSDFQLRVWQALQRIPFGETRTYADIARELGDPQAVRAVGQANRTNRLPILIPCHRVVAADGGLGGYMGSWGTGDGLALKRALLDHEAGLLQLI